MCTSSEDKPPSSFSNRRSPRRETVGPEQAETNQPTIEVLKMQSSPIVPRLALSKPLVVAQSEGSRFTLSGASQLRDNSPDTQICST